MEPTNNQRPRPRSVAAACGQIGQDEAGRPIGTFFDPDERSRFLTRFFEEQATAEPETVDGNAREGGG